MGQSGPGKRAAALGALSTVCGINGELRADRESPVSAEVMARMATAQRHRGPDGDGVRTGPGWGLGHRRLSIVDLAMGQQPMDDGTGELWTVYNGEIYNHEELRAELERSGHRFRTRCDTEVLLHGYRQWGDALPSRLRGMFAFAILDQRTRTLFAARDRLGKKPLHYHADRERIVFGSELKSLLAHPDVGARARVRADVIARFLCLRYVPDPDTVWDGILKLPPGHALTWRDGQLRTSPYWQLSFADPLGDDETELAERVLGLLDDAVRVRLMGEVPLGAFLSGGVDSQAVVDSMSRALRRPVVACGIGFDDPRFDELPFAREAARRCGAELHEQVLHVDDMLEQQWFADTYDEPFSDSSAIPTYHVSRMARQHVTVALSGDGGDEAFAGYRRYRFDIAENRLRAILPSGLWSLLAAVYPKADFLPRIVRLKRTLENLARDPAEAYARSVSASLPEEVLPLLRAPYRDADPEPLGAVVRAYRAADGPDPLSRAAAADFATYLPGDILTKVDRASMAVSLEVRAPLLDHRLVELAARIPAAIKTRGAATKGFFRRALRNRLGEAALERPKQGFSVPMRRWMSGSLGDGLERALGAGRLTEYVDPQPVRGMLQHHRSGLSDHSEILWALLVFDRFLERWVS